MMSAFGRATFMVSTAIACVATAAPVHAQSKSFDIPAQAVETAIGTLGRQADVQIVGTRKAMRGKQANAVRGNMTVQQALGQMLAGTGLGARQTGVRTFTVIPLVLVAREPAAVEATRISRADAILPAQIPPETLPASAEADDAGEIIVTAQKREERLQDVPIPLTAISGQALVERSQVRLRDYFTEVPGLNVTPARSQYQALSIRGITTGLLTNPTVGITVDDVPYGSSSDLGGAAGLPDIDPFDLARIEVLRGPQGVLYGASSMGGLLKFVTIDPSTDALHGRIQFDVNDVHNGKQIGYGVRGGLNIPVTSELAARVSGFYRRDPGYIDNPFLGLRGVNRGRAYGGRGSILFRPADNVTLKLSALVQRTQANAHPDVSRVPGLGDLQQNYVRNAGRNELNVQAYSATLNITAGKATITSISGYNINSITDSVDYTGAIGALSRPLYGVNGARLTFNNRTRKVSQEIRLSTPVTEYADWLVGGYYTHESSTYVQNIIAEDPLTGKASTISLAGLPPGVAYVLSFPTTYEEYAGFTNFTFHITDKFDLQVGGRESHIDQTHVQTNIAPVLGVNTLTISPQRRASASAFTYLVTPRYRVSRDLMVYGRFASGYRAGGTNPNPNFPQYNPDRTETYEIGAKGSLLNRRLTFDLSLYHIRWKDIQITQVDPTNRLSYTANGGAAKSQGVEFSLQARPIQGLTLSGWVAYNNAQLTEDFPASSTAYGRSGDPLPLTGKWSGNVSADYEFAIGGELTGAFGGSASFIDDRRGNFKATAAIPRVLLPGYERIDLRAGLRYDGWSLNLFANNVFDKRGLLAGGDVTPATGYIYIQPRTIGLSVARTF